MLYATHPLSSTDVVLPFLSLVYTLMDVATGVPDALAVVVSSRLIQGFG